MILGIILAYLVVVLIVGTLAHRTFRGTGEDYFLASRTIGPFVLLMTLFGTNMTAFTMLGASGQAYREGIIVFILMGSSSSLVIPLVIYFVGTRLWWLGKKEGYLTQVQFFRERYESDLLGLFLFVVLVSLMLPYVLIGVKGGGDALQAITGGPEQGVASWIGSLLICGVVFIYVSYGGMRSTAWANTFQTLVFMIVGGVTFLVILNNYGGLRGAMATLAETHPSLLAIGDSSHDSHLRYRVFSFLLLPFSVGVFPHIFSHWLSAKDARSFRYSIVFYPLCITLVWVPMVVLGTIGNIDYQAPLDGPILVKLILDNAGGVLAGFLAAGVFAAIMSSLDSQTLATGTMFTQDIVRHYGFHDRLSEKQQVLFRASVRHGALGAGLRFLDAHRPVHFQPRRVVFDRLYGVVPHHPCGTLLETKHEGRRDGGGPSCCRSLGLFLSRLSRCARRVLGGRDGHPSGGCDRARQLVGRGSGVVANATS